MSSIAYSGRKQNLNFMYRNIHKTSVILKMHSLGSPAVVWAWILWANTIKTDQEPADR